MRAVLIAHKRPFWTSDFNDQNELLPFPLPPGILFWFMFKATKVEILFNPYYMGVGPMEIIDICSELSFFSSCSAFLNKVYGSGTDLV